MVMRITLRQKMNVKETVLQILAQQVGTVYMYCIQCTFYSGRDV